MDGSIAENAVWSYEQPYPAMDVIKDRLAFYTNVVAVMVEAAPTPAVGTTSYVDDVIRHTDSGSGAPQAASWAATATNPAAPGD